MNRVVYVMQFVLRMANVPRAGWQRAQRCCCFTGWFGSSDIETFGAIRARLPSARVPLRAPGVHKMELLTLTHGCSAPLPCQELLSVHLVRMM